MLVALAIAALPVLSSSLVSPDSAVDSVSRLACGSSQVRFLGHTPFISFQLSSLLVA